MRIVIDLQGAQARDSKDRGIGRYSRALAHAIIRNRGSHEVLLALNGAFPETLDGIRSEFSDELDPDQIRVWTPLGDTKFADPTGDQRRLVSEAYREYFLSSLNPDIVHVSSLFEGFGDSAVASVGGITSTIPTTVTLYDLIPFVYPETYFVDERFEQWYRNRLDHLQRADRLFAISQSSRDEAITLLGFDPAKVISIGTDADSQFQRVDVSPADREELQRSFGLTHPFVLYTGGIEHRKNVEALIRAYAAVDPALRKKHQLAIVCSINDVQRARLAEVAEESGLSAGEVVLTGFVPEETLLKLYSDCSLFVFPSRHEGFGLPVLEAMRCGAPAIASDCSSLPEIVGLEDALVDPCDERAIASLIEKGLTDKDYRSTLVDNAAKQSRRFSWDKVASTAISAMQQLVAERREMTCSPPSRPRMAYFSPIAPARSGIADYSEELLSHLSFYYDIDVIVEDPAEDVGDAFVRGSIGILSTSEFEERFSDYDRILYHFGNSPYHSHMFDLLERTGGVVVLHDFYLSGVVAHFERAGISDGCWQRELYRSHGYSALQYRRDAEDEYDVDWKYPCNASVIESADHVIVHSQNSVALARQWYGDELARKFSVVPLLATPKTRVVDKEDVRRMLRLDGADFVVCSFGLLGPTKLNDRLLEAWVAAGFADDPRCRLVFVGENNPGPYGSALIDYIADREIQNVTITGWVAASTYQSYLEAADVAVQLRTKSRGETSRAVFDCLGNGASLVVNANGAMAELPADVVTIISDDFEIEEVVAALRRLKSNPRLREKIGKLGQQFVRENHGPRLCARLYRDQIEHASDRIGVRDRFVAAVQRFAPDESAAATLAEHCDQQVSRGRKRLFVDVSFLARFDAKSGIQRVVRNILAEMLRLDSPIRIEPVRYCPDTNRFRFAREFAGRQLGVGLGGAEDEVADIRVGDTFLGLDLNSSDVDEISRYLGELRACGVRIAFVVYDLLPVRHPDCFVPGAKAGHSRWADMVLESDLAICISQAVADDLKAYALETRSETGTEITTFPMGADFHLDSQRKDLADDEREEAERAPTFLMVGTLEPRKCYDLVLDAFEELWKRGDDVQLCIVGKQGWMVDDLVERIVSLSAREPRLTWLSNADDRALARLYRESTCLIAASRDEGYGLPIIEAAHYGLPVIARDIPVFREVGGTWASYFPSAASGPELAQSIAEWLDRRQSGALPTGEPPKSVSWKESAEALLSKLEPNAFEAAQSINSC